MKMGDLPPRNTRTLQKLMKQRNCSVNLMRPRQRPQLSTQRATSEVAGEGAVAFWGATAVLGSVANVLPYLLVAADVVVFPAAVVAGEFKRDAKEVTVGALDTTKRRKRRSQSLMMKQWPPSSRIAGTARALVRNTCAYRLH